MPPTEPAKHPQIFFKRSNSLTILSMFSFIIVWWPLWQDRMSSGHSLYLKKLKLEIKFHRSSCREVGQGTQLRPMRKHTRTEWTSRECYHFPDKRDRVTCAFALLPPAWNIDGMPRHGVEILWAWGQKPLAKKVQQKDRMSAGPGYIMELHTNPGLPTSAFLVA